MEFNLMFLLYLCLCTWCIDGQMTNSRCMTTGVVLNASVTENFITSPGYPDDYANDLNCSWTIQNQEYFCGLIRIDVKDIVLEKGYDKLRLNIGESCPLLINSTKEQLSARRSVKITFTSDFSNTHKGFRLSYSIIGCQMTTSSCPRAGLELNATTTTKFLTSPGFPLNYENDLSCSWTIMRTSACGLIRIDVKTIDLERNFDTLRFSYGSSTSEDYIETRLEHVTPSERVMIRFTSDSSNTGGGFLLSYSITGCQTTDRSTKESIVQLTATSTEQFITSPGFPGSYANYLNRYWIIWNNADCGRIRIDVKSIDLYRSHKLRLFYGASVTPAEYIKGTSVHVTGSKSVTIRFTSDLNSGNRKGFRLSYSIIDLNISTNSSVFGCQDTQLLAEARSKYVSSLNYPEYTMNTNCQWRIFVTDPCSTTNKVNDTQRLMVVVEEFKSSGLSPIKISQGEEGTVIHLTPESNLVGLPLYFSVPEEEYVMIIVHQIGERSTFKFSYQITEPITEPSAEPEHQPDNTLSIALASTICSLCIVTIIVHAVIRQICRNRRQESRISDAVKFQSEKKTKRPYVNFGKGVQSENENQQETTSSGECYEEVDIDEPGTHKRDYRNMDKSESGSDQSSELYINTDDKHVVHTSSVPVNGDEDDVYEEIKDYVNVAQM